MKAPASLADIGIAAAVGWWFRDRPWAALAAIAAVLLWPVTWYVSAWWGQYESIYVLPAVLAVLAARARRPGLVAVLAAISLMTKPQALPFLVPFAAWFLATQGIRGTIKAAVIGLVTIVVLWLPFISASGPTNYLGNLSQYQNDVFQFLSLRAWNPWWAVQVLGAGGAFVLDSTRVLGPLTFRQVGFALAGLLSLVVFIGVYRRPSARNLAMGLAAVTLVAFVCLTQMHERYAYPAFVFLLMAINGRVLFAAWAVFSVTFLANLVAAVPPPELALPDTRSASLVGAAIVTVIAILAVLFTGREAREADTAGEPLHSVWPAVR
jgi:Gpi18-like mannosyltransferase